MKENDLPNILVIMTDDHGQWASHCYGNSELVTPNMDFLAESGILMQNAFAICPVCSPARASFFTGRLPSQHERGCRTSFTPVPPGRLPYPSGSPENRIFLLGARIGMSRFIGAMTTGRITTR